MIRPLLLWLFALLILVPSSDARADAASDEAANMALQKLTARLEDSTVNRDQVRQELITFRRTYPGTPQAVQAAVMLRQLPSPLDKLDPKFIPPLERFAWQPKELVAILGEHRGRQGTYPYAVAISPNGKLIVSGGANGTIRLWDRATMRQQGILGSAGGVAALAFSRDGKTLAASGGGYVVLFDMTVEKPQRRAMFLASTAAVTSLAISPNGQRLVVGTTDSTARLWDLTLKEPKEIGILGGHEKTVYSVAFAPDGKTVATASGDQTVRLWDVTKEPPMHRSVLKGHTKEVAAVAFSPDGRLLVSGGYDGIIRIWSLAGNKPREHAALDSQSGIVYCLSFAPNSRLMAAGYGDFTVRLWDLSATQPKERHVLKGHTGVIYSVSLAADGRALASCSGDWTVRLWQSAGGKFSERTIQKGHLSHSYPPAFAPDGKTLASVSQDATLRLWSFGGTEARERSILKDAATPLWTVAYPPDGKTLAAGGASGVIHLWDTGSNRKVRTLEPNPSHISCLSFGPDSHQLLAASYKNLVLWDAARGVLLRKFEALKTPIASACLSPDGHYALSGSGYYLYKDGFPVYKNGQYVYEDCTVRLWDTQAGKELDCNMDHTVPLASVAFAAAGQRAFTGASDSTFRFWEVSASRLRTADTVKGSLGAVSLLTPSPDGKTLASYGPDGKVIVWDLATKRRLREWTMEELVGGLAFAPDSRHLAVTLATGVIYILRLEALTS
jgi:WD40 repeat protein